MKMSKTVQISEFGSAEQAIDYLCVSTADILSRALADKGQAHMVLSGGQSPTRYLPILAGKLEDWSGVQVSLSDERWVPIGHNDSNQGMIEHTFIAHAPGVKLMGMMGQGDSAETDARTASTSYANLPWPADISLLGVGPDGHVASLFPGYAHRDGQQLVIATRDGAGYQRLSMSPETLLNSKMIYLLASGEVKRSIIKRATQSGSVEDLPLRTLLLQDTTRVEVLMC